jgi:hypothetical protein
MLGKQSLPLRGHRNEAGHSLNSTAENHGNFLATVQLMAKYDPLLAAHTSSVQQQSEKRMKHLEDMGKKGSKGRGGLVTFLSKSTINALNTIMRDMIQEKIKVEVKKAKVYSIQVDSSQDVSSIDQFSVVIRYVNGSTVHERLLAMVPSNEGTGQGLFDLLNATLQRLDIDIKNCISDSTDGAASYHGQYNGLQSKIAEVADHHVHIWCYAHVLNLVLTETTKCCIQAISFFDLLQNMATFVKVSYKRTAVWIDTVRDHLGNEKMKRLKLIGETRWSGKSNAARAIFGSFSEPSANTFVDVVICFTIISSSDRFDPKARREASVLLSALLGFETILTAFTYLCIFEVSAPLSSYLQTSGLNLFSACKLVQKAVDDLKAGSRNFNSVHARATKFVRDANLHISMLNNEGKLDQELDLVKMELPVKRIRKAPKRPGELANDERDTSDSLTDFRVNVYNVVLDRVIQSLETRFTAHHDLYRDMSAFDPSNFHELVVTGLADREPFNSITKFCGNSRQEDIRMELLSFASNFDILKMNLGDNGCGTACGDCPPCVLSILSNHRLHEKAYDNLYDVYKVICTLSVTQVQCERSFSKLKIIKTRLRNTMTDEHLETFMLMAMESDLLDSLTNEEVIDRFALTSSETKRLLRC